MSGTERLRRVTFSEAGETMPPYEKLAEERVPKLDELAFLHFDDQNPVRDHWVCYCVSGFERPRRYAIASMAAEDTNFYDYCGAPPADRGLEIYSMYRVHDSDRVNGYDQEHIIICFADRTIEFTGLSFGVSGPFNGQSALRVLVSQLPKQGFNIA